VQCLRGIDAARAKPVGGREDAVHPVELRLAHDAAADELRSLADHRRLDRRELGVGQGAVFDGVEFL